MGQATTTSYLDRRPEMLAEGEPRRTNAGAVALRGPCFARPPLGDGASRVDLGSNRQTQPPPRHVLLVEDDTLISAMTAMALADFGFCVHTAASGAAALRHLSEGTPVDVLFTDLNLADDIGGETVARRARELRPGLPVAYASGTATGVAAPVPGSAFFAKPYAVDQVCAILARMAAEQSAGHSDSSSASCPGRSAA